jgi:phage/plasmid-associated DNA primase
MTMKEFQPLIGRKRAKSHNPYDLAEWVIARVPGDGIRHWAGRFYTYDAPRGFWTVLDRLPTLDLRGRKVAGSPVKLTPNKADQIRRAARELAACDDWPEPRAGVATPDGFVTVEGGRVKVREHAPEHRATVYLDVELATLDTAPDAPEWQRFTRAILTPANGDTAERDAKIHALEAWIGVALLGQATELQTALLLIGATDDTPSGKSSLLFAIRGLFDGPVSSVTPHNLANPTGHYAHLLQGSQLNVCAEVPRTSLRDVAKIKAVIVGDPIDASSKYAKSFRFCSRAAHTFACNKEFPSRDRGLLQRLLILRCERKFRPTDSDFRREAHSALVPERRAIVQRCLVAGVAALQAGEIVRPRSSFHMGTESDPLTLWLESVDRKSNARTDTKSAYEAFTDWCVSERRGLDRRGEVALSRNRFTRVMTSTHGFAKKRSGGKNYILGLRLHTIG